MFDAKKYIVNGSVEREKIALDIKYRRLNKDDIAKLTADTEIQDAFFGNGFSKKKAKKEWSKEYLDELSYAVIATGFNSEYLYYLNEVAEYVNKRKNTKKIMISCVILALAIVSLILVILKP